MPRQPRIFSHLAAYHIITRGNNRQRLFHTPEDYKRYLFILQSLKSKFSFDLYHYCLMSNHVHLLIKFPSIISFRSVLHRISLLYAKYFAGKYKHHGHVFQDRFKGWVISDNNYLLECGRYIERNPIKAGMVLSAGDYEWSSGSVYLFGIENPLITRNPMYQDLGNSDEERQRAYSDYLRIERPFEAAMAKILHG